MKKSIVVSFILALCMGALFTGPVLTPAETPSWSNFVSQPIVAMYAKDSIWLGLKYDSLASTDDTCMLKRSWKPDASPGWQYCLAYSAPSGAGASALIAVVDLACKDYNGNILYTVTLDTLQTGNLAGKALLLPIGTTAVGAYYDLMIRTVSGSGESKTYINRCTLVRRRIGP